MTTAVTTAVQSAYDRLTSEEATPPNYLVAILLAAIPTVSNETPLLSRAEWNEDGETVTWRIIAADGQRLVHIEVTGTPAEYGRRYDTPLQATRQNVTISPLRGSVTKVEANVKARSGWPDKGLQWRTTWTIQFSDGSSLTVPTEKEARLSDRREKIDQFVQGFLALALPR